MHTTLEFRAGVEASYPDLFTPATRAALEALAPLDADRKALMTARLARIPTAISSFSLRSGL